MSSRDDDGHSHEDEVLERIEAWRRRRPKLKDEYINSAHGAGGKASAALIDAVFLEAFRNKTLESMSDGAVPQWISAGFVIEDGFSIAELRDIVADMAAAAIKAGVKIVTGDTKVVDKGACDGVYITTAGVGVIPAGIHLDAKSVRPGDKVIVSGKIGDHG